MQAAAGQGKTEYILVVAFIAIAAVGGFGLFGSNAEKQAANVAQELAGGNATSIQTSSGGSGGGGHSGGGIGGSSGNRGSSGGGGDAGGGAGNGGQPGGNNGGGNGDAGHGGGGSNSGGGNNGGGSGNNGGDGNNGGEGNDDGGSGNDKPTHDSEADCETTWEDDRYKATECNGRWYCGLVEWGSELKAAANAVWDFVEGIVAGLGDQVSDLWNLLTDPGVLKDLAEAFIKDPKGTVEAVVADLGEDVQKVVNCGPADIGRIAGQNINPLTAVRVVGKLGRIAGNRRLTRYGDDLERRIDCASFPAGTLILTPNGQIEIENIIKGSEVNSRDELSLRNSAQKVAALHSRQADGYQRIQTEFGIIEATSEHPFWVQGKGWVEASDLQWEDPIVTADGDVVIYNSEYIDEPATVYNFTVDDTPNYFAGAMQVWVHNANCNIDLAKIPLINGRRPINYRYAGQTYPLDELSPELRAKYPDSVKFTEQGFPDFSPYKKASAAPEGLTGDYSHDAARANAAVGLSTTPEGYVWHHVEDGKTMILIPQDIHGAVRHTGGSAVIRNGGFDP